MEKGRNSWNGSQRFLRVSYVWNVRTSGRKSENASRGSSTDRRNRVQFLASFSGNTEFETIRGKLAVALLSHFHFPAKFLIGRVRLFHRESRSSLGLYNADERRRDSVSIWRLDDFHDSWRTPDKQGGSFSRSSFTFLFLRNEDLTRRVDENLGRNVGFITIRSELNGSSMAFLEITKLIKWIRISFRLWERSSLNTHLAKYIRWWNECWFEIETGTYFTFDMLF